MDRRDFLKTSIISTLFATSPLLGATRKNRFHFIMPPKPFEYFIKKGKEKGGKVLIIGGIHGNENGSYKASDILIDTEIKKGVLAILPRSNPESIFTNMRGYNGDMNRKFSYISKNDEDLYKINSIKEFIADFKPDVILSLHDGYGFYARNHRNWGESIVIDETNYKNLELLKTASFVSNHLKKHNYNIPINNTHTFAKKTHHKEQRKSLTYYALTEHNTPAFCIEASKQTDLKRKVEIHLLAIEAFLKLYNVEITPSFNYLFSNLEKLLEEKNPKIIVNINNEKKIITKDTTLKIPTNTEIIFETSNRSDGLIAKNVNVNYKSFFYRDNIIFEVKNDNLTKYHLKIIKG